MLDLGLSVTNGAWKAYSARKSDPGFLSFSKKVFTRDRYTCQFCGFQAREYQEIVNLDQDYNNNKLSNLVTACIFCTQCFFLEAVGKGSFGGGTLIYLPEISQANLNSFCHVLFCAITNETAYKNSVQTIYRSLKFRAQIVEEHFGEGTSEPWVLGQLLLDCEVPSAKISAMLKDLRLLPSRGRFKKQIEWWADAALQELSTEA